MKNSFQISSEIKSFSVGSILYCVTIAVLTEQIFLLLNVSSNSTCVKSIPAQTFQKREGNWLNKYF